MNSGIKPQADARKRRDKDRRLRQAARFARILSLLELLQSRVRYNAGSLATELGVSRRTVQRDLDVLELAGIPCTYIAEQGGYVLSGDYRFAVTGLTADELLGQATATALTSAKGLDVGRGAEPTTRKLQATGHRNPPKLLEDALRVTAVLDLKLAHHEGHRDAIKVIQEALVGNMSPELRRKKAPKWLSRATSKFGRLPLRKLLKGFSLLSRMQFRWQACEASR